MKAHLASIAVMGCLALSPCLADDSDFRREKDLSHLEGKEAPQLQVDNWLNTEDGAAISLADLKGKVVVVDFWGVW